jgi:5-hydroxyisourate hydrolase-like protein (transthyretin family)
MKKIFPALITLSSMFACKKGIQEDKLYLRGRLFLTDTITQNVILLPLPNKKVLLCNNDADTLNFLYSDSTDHDGYFDFVLSEENKNKELTIRFNDTLKNYYYTAKSICKNGDVNVVLNAILDENKMNGLSFITKDEDGGNISNTTVLLYNSKNLAIIGDSATAVKTLIADTYGKFYYFSLPSGNYYLNAYKKADTIIYERLLREFTVSAKGIYRDTLQMKRKYSQHPNTMFIKVTDTLGGIIPAASIYVYTSNVLAESNDPSGAIITSVTDNNGNFIRTNMVPGTYFINAKKTADTITYSSRQNPVILPTSGTVNQTIILRKI